MLNLRRLQILREFSARGTIVATANALGYTPSAVSQQLATLERETGVALLDRSARGAELTDAGRLLVAQAEDILALVEATESVIAEQSDLALGVVTVTAFPTAAVAFAPLLVPRLRRHEGMQLLLRQTLLATGTQQVRSREVDIALVDDWARQHPGRGPDIGLRHIHLMRDPMVLAVPEDHPLADPSTPVVLETLLSESWIVTPESERSRYGMDRLLAEVGGLPSSAWEFEGLGTVLSLVSRGIGIAAVPALAMAGGPAGLVYRGLPPAAPERDVYAVVRSVTARRPAVQVTLAALRDAARQVGEEISETALA
ncbi:MULTISPECIES: LysR family transcriptional regulator [Nocardiopsis]|uniref:DNA-binding transcriptional LysR family regulator n=1 Tax=Nocardiopsis sinuspersici TaxID=501010 RepID=A0A1V3BWK2_9ACTN|nr:MULTISPECIES: LysR family transcriptional regulator [Nocardiopsis]NYH54061.1 DNA-binding transcriptional LysR family regulator [Nocardiopsis sinuspersici]OOC52901.1 LysR family transcriptional regulator [Nocardiopsis sinuspersici]